MIRRRLMDGSSEQWELIEERIINNGDNKIKFSSDSMASYKKFHMLIDINTLMATQVFLTINGADSTSYHVGNLTYAGKGRRTMDWYLEQNEDGILTGTWTGTINGAEQSGEKVDRLNRSLPVNLILVRTTSGNMESGEMILYGMK